MNTIDTVVIGAGHAGLAVSRLLTEAGRDHVVLDRGRVARAVAHRALGLPAPADPELDDPAARLARTRGPDPDGYMSRRPSSSRHLERYAASFGAPVRRRYDGRASWSSDRGDGYRVVTDRGTWRARPRRDRHRPARPAARARRPGAARPGRRAGQLPAATATRSSCRPGACSWSAPRPPACRSPTSSPGPAARWSSRSAGTPGCRAATAAWTSSGGWSAPAGWPAPSTRCPTPVAARREPSLQLVGRNEPEHVRRATSTCGTLQRPGVRLVGRVDGRRRARRARFARRPRRDTSRRADRRMHRFLDAVDRHVDADRAGRRGAGPRCDRDRSGVAGRRRAGSTCAPRASAPSCWRPATGPHHPWLRLPVTGAGRHDRQRRGVTPAPGLYVVGQRFQHRRDSGVHRRRPARRPRRRRPPAGRSGRHRRRRR